jgi:heavy metal sensor kinase
VSRVPIRLRVTVAFVAAMALVLLAVGSLIHVRYRSELNASIDRGLRSRAGDVASLLRDPANRSNPLTSRSESLGEDNFTQVLTRSGGVIDTSGRSTSSSVLSPAALHAAARRPTFSESDRIPRFDATARLLATAVDANGRRLIAVVGTPLDDRDEALASLATLLWLGGAAALLLASLVGYAAVTFALRPVDAISRRAAEISAADPAERLPVPTADDELRRLGDTLNAMLDRLESAIERERSFVDDASHELRTPLALQKAELELALRHARNPDELRAAIASAISEADRLSQLADDLLVLARSDKGTLAVKVEQIEVAELIASLGERFRERAEAAQVRLEADSPGGLFVEGDRLRLEQALGNLIDNALRHGGGPVRLWGRRVDSAAELHVSDSGPGFPPAFLPHAFERFSRADAARTDEGTGLGLAIVATIARAHGGQAMASNCADGGADVWLALPVSHHTLIALRNKDADLQATKERG